MRAEDVPHTGLVAELGLRIEEVAADRVSGSMPISAGVMGADGSVHHGAISSAIESVASIAAAAHLGDEGHVVGVANATSYFATASDGVMSVVAEPVSRLGDRQEWVVRVTSQDGRLLAQGNVQLANIRHAGRLGRS